MKTKRRRHNRGKKHIGPVRPGAFFRPIPRYAHVREDEDPFSLGHSDWLVYRKDLCPYKPGTYKAKRYVAGFHSSKKSRPKPEWRPL